MAERKAKTEAKSLANISEFQKVSEMWFDRYTSTAFQGDKGMQHLLSSKFQLGADASAAAGPVGRHASANTDWKLDTEVLTYSRAKGAFAGLTLTGADLRRDDDSMEAYYGHDISTRRVLTGEVEMPAAAHAFIDAVREAKAQAKAAN